MKPRLFSAPLTPEDEGIMFRAVCLRGSFAGVYFYLQHLQDRRDAELMYQRQQHCTVRYREGHVVAGSGQTPRSWWCLPL